MSLSDSGLISLTGQLSIGSLGGEMALDSRKISIFGNFTVKIIGAYTALLNTQNWWNTVFFLIVTFKIIQRKEQTKYTYSAYKDMKTKTDTMGNMRHGGLCLKAKIQFELCIWWKWSVVPISTMEYSQNGAKKDKALQSWLSSYFLGNSWSDV